MSDAGESVPRPRGKGLLVAAGAGALVAGGVLAALFVRRAPPPPAGPDLRPSSVPVARPSRPASASPGPGRADEAAALYARAEAFEREHPGDREGAIPLWREVFLRHPSSPWARKAEENHRAAADGSRALLEREFDGVRRGAQALAAAGEYADAIEAVKEFLAAQPKDALRRRAEEEVSALQNASRAAFNALVPETEELAKKGEFEKAAALLEGLRPGAIPEVAARCERAVARLRELAAGERVRQDAAKLEGAHRAFREGGARRILQLLRARRHEEALKEFHAAAADPALAPVREEIEQERSAVALAASFWEAFLRQLRGRTGQEVSILLASGSRAAGKLSRVGEDRVVVEAGGASSEVLLDEIHLDQVVAWTVGKALPADDPATCVRAALFFFGEGRDDLARLYFATAREMGRADEASERVFREGFLRAAAHARTAKPGK
jgi:hypothetical protein